MMKTIIVVSQVSFQLGQVTFVISRRTSLKNCERARATAHGRRQILARSVRRLFRRVSHFVSSFSSTWQEWRDSNPRPSVLETDALPTELHS